MMDRRTLLALAASALAAPPLAAQSGQRPKIGFVSAVDRNPQHYAAFETGLRESGMEPGRSLEILERYAGGSLERLRSQIDELAGLGTSVFVTAGDNAMQAIQERAPDVPIVAAVISNYGNVVLGGSINRPPGNVTGFSNLSAEMAVKRLDLLRKVVPGLDKVVILVNPRTISRGGRQAEAYVNSAQSLKIAVRLQPLGSRVELGAALRKARGEGAGGVIVFRNFLFETRRDEILAAIASAGLPSMFEERFYVERGGLISYSTNLVDLVRRAGGYAARVLAGTPASDLPIQLPTKFEMVVNAKAAKGLGLSLPNEILVSADEIIE